MVTGQAARVSRSLLCAALRAAEREGLQAQGSTARAGRLRAGAKGFIAVQAPYLILNKPTLVTGAGLVRMLTPNEGRT